MALGDGIAGDGGATGTPAGANGRRRRRAGRGTTGVASNFARMGRTFGTVGGAGWAGAAAGGAWGGAPGMAGAATTTAPPGWAYHDGAWWQWNPATAQWVLAPDAPPTHRPAVSDARPLTMAGVLDKTILLAVVAVAAGGLAALADLGTGPLVVAMVAALGVGLWCTFSPRRARVLAPLFAVLEGGVLGIISRAFAAQSHDVVPSAVVGTGLVFLGVLFAYRTGLVRVGRRFVVGTAVGGMGLLVAMVVMLFAGGAAGDGGGLGTLLVFGVLYLLVAVADLFVDFELVRQAEVAGVSAEAEWYAAFTVVLAVMMMYLALLRIMGGRR